MSTAPDKILRIHQHARGTAVILTAAGDIDIVTAPLLAEQLANAVKTVTPPGPVVTDLRQVDFFCVKGIRVLRTAQQLCGRHAVLLRVVAACLVTRILDAAGEKNLAICDTLDTALLAAPASAHDNP